MKYWNSNIYAPASRIIGVYSQRLSREVLEWSKQDVAQANAIMPHVFLLARQDGAAGTYDINSAASVSLAAPQAKQPKPDAAEEAALDALDMIHASEKVCSGLIGKATQDRLLKHLHEAVDLSALVAISEMRMRDVRDMDAMIRNGKLWESAEPRFWHCLKCGNAVQGRQAFQECPCCKSGRAYATVGGW